MGEEGWRGDGELAVECVGGCGVGAESGGVWRRCRGVYGRAVEGSGDVEGSKYSIRGAVDGSGEAVEGSGEAVEGSAGAVEGSGGTVEDSGRAVKGSGGAIEGSGGAVEGSEQCSTGFLLQGGADAPPWLRQGGHFQSKGGGIFTHSPKFLRTNCN